MKLLYLHSELGVLAGGGENFSRHLIQKLVQRGHRITVVCIARRNGTIPIPLPPGVEPMPLPGYWNRQWGQATLSFLGGFLTKLPELQPLWRRIQLACEWRAIYWHNRRFGRRVQRLLTGRWSHYDLAYVHGDTLLAADIAPKLPTCLRLPGPIDQDTAARLTGVQIICGNGDVLGKLLQLFGHGKMVRELPVGLDSEHFSPEGENFKNRLGWNNGEIVIGYVGRLTVLKGVKLLAESFIALRGRYPFLRLLLVGNGEELQAIQKMLDQVDLTDRYHLAGVQPTETLPFWYRSMDLFVMPSLYENFSNAILEAMGCGLPVLASRVGGNQLAVEEGVTGWLFESGSSKSLTAALVTALEHQDDFQTMARRGRLEVEQKSWEHTAVAFEEMVKPYLNQTVSSRVNPIT